MSKIDQEFQVLLELFKEENQFFGTPEEKKALINRVLRDSRFGDKHPNPSENQRRYRKMQKLFIREINELLDEIKQRNIEKEKRQSTTRREKRAE